MRAAIRAAIRAVMVVRAAAVRAVALEARVAARAVGMSAAWADACRCAHACPRLTPCCARGRR